MISIFRSANRFNKIAAIKKPKPTPRKTSETTVEFSIGQATRTLVGAGSKPSLATITALLPPAGIASSANPSPRLWFIQRSEPLGLASSVVPATSRTPMAVPSSEVTASECKDWPTHASTSASRPKATKTSPSPMPPTTGSPGIKASSSAGITR